DETAGVNGLGKRTHRRREFRRRNCGLAHGKLLRIVGSMVRTVEREVARAKSTNSLLFMTENRQFDHFIIIKMILTAAHDSAIPCLQFEPPCGILSPTGRVFTSIVSRPLWARERAEQLPIGEP